MTEKLMNLFRVHLKTKHEIVFYPYQEEVAVRIFDALISNLRMTQGATEESIKKLKQVELPIEFSRQSGKTTTIVYVIEFIMLAEKHTYLEAIIAICDEQNIEYVDIIPLLTPPLIAKLEAEAREKNILPHLNNISAFM